MRPPNPTRPTASPTVTDCIFKYIFSLLTSIILDSCITYVTVTINVFHYQLFLYEYIRIHLQESSKIAIAQTLFIWGHQSYTPKSTVPHSPCPRSALFGDHSWKVQAKSKRSMLRIIQDIYSFFSRFAIKKHTGYFLESIVKSNRTWGEKLPRRILHILDMTWVYR